MSWWRRSAYACETVEQKRFKAEKLIKKLSKKNPDLKPVRIEGKALARTFWGKAWCRHMDQMADYDNRLPRGRSYARNSAICHLDIRQGEIEVLVSGTRMYTVNMRVKPLEEKQWALIQKACAGKIDTLLNLLQGKLSKEVMSVVCHPETGIFPKPDEISYQCSCPDWADLCKHVAAVFYGVGARLDEQPELLFLLRHADPGELFSLDMAAHVDGGDAAELEGVDLGAMFGIELTDDDAKPPAQESDQPSDRKAARLAEPPPPPKSGRPPKRSARASKPDAPVKLLGLKIDRAGKSAPAALPDVDALTGNAIAALREALDLSLYQFASRLDVTEATVRRWEKTSGIVRLQKRPRAKLLRLVRA
ncbi:MAG: SWIM zinc finger family protein [Desulfovibrio sp.]|jgi:uncharacterized Zn finger protein/DNA-binding transcriptional regulator YiaG|nr:SWIM zinc finger family protein [Desulfovibrio sp.]